MRRINILVACEESQRVTIEFRKLGHNAFSCDIIDCSGGHPEWHIKQDVLPLLNGNCSFKTVDGSLHTIDGKWDMIIAFPPCTHLCNSGQRWFHEHKKPRRLQFEAIQFFYRFILANCEKIAVENPMGIMSTCFEKPTQIVQPYEYGHPVRKTTCLWLKNLPLLQPTEVVKPEIIHSNGRTGGYSGNSWHCKDENGKILSWNNPLTAKIRSKTYPGIAKAMATQWGTSETKEKDR